ncbi:MAG: MBL fold metallo-hydrolase [Dehalococcoidia bacterium]|nr:MBL fold metallo-hydrolase [Dehalococcoidia bacterium]
MKNKAMLLRALELGPFLANCYIVGSDGNGEGIIIDPVAEAETIMDNVRQLGLTIKLIIATHSHPDHIMALGQIKEETGAPFAMHEAESAGMIASGMARVMGMFMSGSAEPLPKPDMSLQDGEAIEVGDLSFTVLHTPGHSPGGISLYGHGMVFVGDTLFNFSIGRTDFPGCSHQQLIESINSKLLTLPDETIVYPGHGPQTTIRAERQHNPFLIG